MEEIENRLQELQGNTSDDGVEPTAPIEPSGKPHNVLPQQRLSQQPGEVVLGDEGEPPPPSYADVMVDAPSDDDIECPPKFGFKI